MGESKYLWSPKVEKERALTGAVGSLSQGAENIPSDERKGFPEFPRNAWVGILRGYINLVEPSTEAPETFHFATVVSVLGMCPVSYTHLTLPTILRV